MASYRMALANAAANNYLLIDLYKKIHLSIDHLFYNIRELAEMCITISHSPEQKFFLHCLLINSLNSKIFSLQRYRKENLRLFRPMVCIKGLKVMWNCWLIAAHLRNKFISMLRFKAHADSSWHSQA